MTPLVTGRCILMALPGQLESRLQNPYNRFESGPHLRKLLNMNGFLDQESRRPSSADEVALGLESARGGQLSGPPRLQATQTEAAPAAVACSRYPGGQLREAAHLKGCFKGASATPERPSAARAN